jgi:hypothetical protein
MLYLCMCIHVSLWGSAGIPALSIDDAALPDEGFLWKKVFTV